MRRPGNTGVGSVPGQCLHLHPNQLTSRVEPICSPRSVHDSERNPRADAVHLVGCLSGQRRGASGRPPLPLCARPSAPLARVSCLCCCRRSACLLGLLWPRCRRPSCLIRPRSSAPFRAAVFFCGVPGAAGLGFVSLFVPFLRPCRPEVHPLSFFGLSYFRPGLKQPLLARVAFPRSPLLRFHSPACVPLFRVPGRRPLSPRPVSR